MNKKQIIITSIIITVLVVMTISLTCCMSFKPIWIKDLPAECNMSLNVYRMYYKSADKSGIVTITEVCAKKLQRLSCQADVFGIDDKGIPNPVNYDDPKLYRNYNECLKELK